jgi:hypothetical protein
VACDFHNREVLGIDPYFALKQILVFAFRHGLQDKTVIRADCLLSSQRERIVCGRDRTVALTYFRVSGSTSCNGRGRWCVNNRSTKVHSWRCRRRPILRGLWSSSGRQAKPAL